MRHAVRMHRYRIWIPPPMSRGGWQWGNPEVPGSAERRTAAEYPADEICILLLAGLGY
jgi:hypothetical protein